MVLIRAFYVLLVIASIASTASTAGCGQSLFDAHGDRQRDGGPGGDDGGPDAEVPKSCPATCIADAAADLDKPPNRWRYLEEGPGHVWVDMDRNGNELTGKADARNSIKRCSDNPSASACQGLLDALLVSSAGDASSFVPALELKAMGASQVLQLVVRVHVPSDSIGHRVRLYRNGREDILFTAIAMPGGTVEYQDLVDALPDDRFLVALEPMIGTVGGAAALHFFVSDPDLTFPRTCRLAIPFTIAAMTTATTVDNLCGGAIESIQNATPTAPVTGVSGPFTELGTAGYFESDIYFRATGPLAMSDPMTVQFWMNDQASNGSALFGWLFSNIDMDTRGGLGIRLHYIPALKIEASVFNGGTYAGPSIAYPTALPLPSWHFVRVVHTSGMVTICIDGVAGMTNAPLTGPTESIQPPHFGRDSADGFSTFTGVLDDMRVFSSALPCI